MICLNFVPLITELRVENYCPPFEHASKPQFKKNFAMTYTFLFLGNLNMTELLVILGVVLLLFGGKKIPELMRGIGKGIREFNNARHSIEEEIKEGMKDVDKKKIEEKRAAEQQ